MKNDKRGFYPPRTFEIDARSYVAAMTENAGQGKPWGGIPGNDATEIGVITQRLNEYTPLRQQFEQKRREYDAAKLSFVEAGREMWNVFFTAIEHARAAARGNKELAAALERFGRNIKRKAPPETPDQSDDK